MPQVATHAVCYVARVYPQLLSTLPNQIISAISRPVTTLYMAFALFIPCLPNWKVCTPNAQLRVVIPRSDRILEYLVDLKSNPYI